MVTFAAEFSARPACEIYYKIHAIIESIQSPLNQRPEIQSLVDAFNALGLFLKKHEQACSHFPQHKVSLELMLAFFRVYAHFSHIKIMVGAMVLGLDKPNPTMAGLRQKMELHESRWRHFFLSLHYDVKENTTRSLRDIYFDLGVALREDLISDEPIESLIHRFGRQAALAFQSMIDVGIFTQPVTCLQSQPRVCPVPGIAVVLLR